MDDVEYCIKKFSKFVNKAEYFDISFQGCERYGLNKHASHHYLFEDDMRTAFPVYNELIKPYGVPAQAVFDYRLTTAVIAHQAANVAYFPIFNAYNVLFEPTAYGPIVNIALAEFNLKIDLNEMQFYFPPTLYATDNSYHLAHVNNDEPFEKFAEQTQRLFVHRALIKP